MIDRRIEFDEAYYDDGEDLLTIYFTAPAELFFNKKDYPDAVAAEISVELSPHLNPIEAHFANVEISPTIEEEDGSFTDYDWREYSVPYEEIEELIELAKRAGVFDEKSPRVNCKL